MNRKKRILLCCEATYLNTGYATYGREIMKRLFHTNKYDLAEFASYGDNADPRSQEIPWGFYGNLPDKTNEQEVDEYTRLQQINLENGDLKMFFWISSRILSVILETSG